MNKVLIWVGKFQIRKNSPKAQLMFSLKSFLMLELQIIRNGVSWFGIKSKSSLKGINSIYNRPDTTLIY